MPNQYRSEKRTIGNLLSTTNPPVVVPDWQRSYSWTTTEVATFWQDLITFSELYPNDNISGQEYFLGSVVIVDATDDHLLLDGQQRISTAAILLSVIREYLKRYSADAATRTQSRYLGDFDDAKNEYSYKVTMNEYDRDYFKRKILESRDAGYSEPEDTLASHRRISKAREFFENRFEESYAALATPEQAHQWALRIQNVLTNHMSVVAIFSQDEDNAATVFETLNDRGIGLSTPDLLRNLILGRAVPGNREEIIDLWREVLEVEGDASLNTFLRHYWISHYGDVKTRSLYREIKGKIVAEGLDSLELSRALKDASLVYHDILGANSDSAEVARLLTDVSELGAAILHPVILSTLQVIELEHVPSLLEALVDTFVRHSVIAQLENSRLENILYRLARDIRADRAVEAIQGELVLFAPDDDQFQRAFASVTIPRRATARYILRKLELDQRATEELEIAPPDKVHVEHVYPQTPQPDHRLDRHAQLINRLGNLTLLSNRLNTAIQNSPFALKKPRYTESELLLTRAIAEYEEWTEVQIDTRQGALSDRVAQIWPILAPE